MKHSFGSDNYSGIHPDILKAIAEANSGHMAAYGYDPVTAEAEEAVRRMLDCDSEVLFVFNGTGANVLALRSITRPYHSVICADTAHIWEHECGAPEAHTGCKLVTVATPDGKLTPELVKPHLFNFNFEHTNRPKVISITQPTEVGTLYTVEEITSLAGLAHSYDMLLHLDGTRFANAAAAMNITPNEMVVKSGVDVMTLGGTKNGMMIGESVVFLKPGLAADAKYDRKQLMQLSSKMRFVAAQFNAYLKDGLWLKLAAHANNMAGYLAEKISGVPEIKVLQKPETNGVFVGIPEKMIPRLQAGGYYHNNNEAHPEHVRWMCSFDTEKEDIDLLADFLKSIC